MPLKSLRIQRMNDLMNPNQGRIRRSQANASRRRVRLPYCVIAVLVSAALALFVQLAHAEARSAARAIDGRVSKGATAHDPPPDFVDEEQCAACHDEAVREWQGSRHRMAMGVADRASVLGDFAQAQLVGEAETTRFIERDGGYWMRTRGADGKIADFKVAFTIGVEPLQQYLLEAPGGRLQASGVAWDTQRKRWFDLYPGQKMDSRNELHWSKPAQNANFVCMECHTTGFERRFDRAAGTFSSRWHRPGVGCQACHGPASKHLQWSTSNGSAITDGGGGKGFGKSVSVASAQIEACGRCHSRREPLADGFRHENDLFDDYLPDILSGELYGNDGKIRDEVFEWGSFAQSRMFGKGVICSDCHNAHSGRLKATGNGVCLQCHNPKAVTPRPAIDRRGLAAKDYESPGHHRHERGRPGSNCVDCHMPGRQYMVVDHRRDHGFTIPNPAAARRTGSDDACLGCHGNSPADEIERKFEQWYGGSRDFDGGYAEAVHLARNGLPGAAAGLLRQLARQDLPAIRRATLLTELAAYPNPNAAAEAVRALMDPSPQVREAAVGVIAYLVSAAMQVEFLGSLLVDPIRAVRINAAWQLAQLPADFRVPVAARWASAIREYEETQNSKADRAEANLNLAMLHLARGEVARAELALREALERNPDFVPAIVILAQLLEGQGQVDKARRQLTDALQRHPDAAVLFHSMGFAHVRGGESTKALDAFRRAAALSPNDPRYGYTLAVAMHDHGMHREAVTLLDQILKKHPANRELRQALIRYQVAAGKIDEVRKLRRDLAEINPGDPLLQ